MTETPRDAPTVSIIIPCFRQAEFLPDAIASVEAQSRSDWEIVLVDDGSPDDVVAVAETAAQRLPGRFQFIQQPNSGVAAARNIGIAAARGRFIVPLDADDRIEPEFLARTLAVLEANSNVGVAYTDWQEFGDSSRVVLVPEFDFEGLCRSNHICNTAAYRRSAWVAVGGYDTKLTLAFEDWDLWLGCAERGFMPRHVPGALMRYRIRSGSRNDRTPGERRAMMAVIRANHPALYTRRRRILRRVRRAPRNIVRQLGRVAARVTGARLRPRAEPW